MVIVFVSFKDCERIGCDWIVADSPSIIPLNLPYMLSSFIKKLMLPKNFGFFYTLEMELCIKNKFNVRLKLDYFNRFRLIYYYLPLNR